MQLKTKALNLRLETQVALGGTSLPHHFRHSLNVHPPCVDVRPYTRKKCKSSGA